MKAAAIEGSAGLRAPDIVATKLAASSVRDGYVPRPRLIGALDAGRNARLSLVDAPTGYGKTMLLAAWCARLTSRGEGAIAWVSLAPTENDPALFMRYLLDALRRAGAEVSERTEALVRVPGGSPVAWMRSLVNDLAGVNATTTLVLDDYHLVKEPACHELVQFLLDHAPESLHLVISTRTDPPIALGSLRARGELTEIRADQLRFTPQEAAELLVGHEGLQLDSDAVARIAARTEGWGAGLYLAALWLRSSGAQEHDALRFAGGNRHVVDYLSEAVLEQLDGELREFLLSTSIADRLCTSLCEAITDRPAIGMLEEIERSNLFLIPLDDTRTWYRYHHLFGEMLRSELARRDPALVAGLHRRAATWFRSSGLVSEAIDHAAAAGDYGDAADLISEHWLEAGRSGQEATVRRWLDAFNADQLRLFPDLGVVGALMIGVSGGSEAEFRRWLELAEYGLGQPDAARRVVAGTTSFAAAVNMLRSTFGYRNVGTAAAIAARTVRMESATQGQFRVPALANLAFLLYLSGDPATARHALSEAVRDPQARRRPLGFITALATAALITLDEGDNEAGGRTAKQALDYATTAGLADNQIAGLPHVALGRAAMAAHRTDEARKQMQWGVLLLRGGVMPARHAYGLLCAAPVMHAAGDLAAALELLDEAEGILASFEDAGTLTGQLHDIRRRLALARRRSRAPRASALTESEVAVLRLLRGSKTQREIAQELLISINTIKTHTSAIYRKLGVTSRHAAVARARELDLL